MTEADFVFTVNVTMGVAETATIDEAASIIEDAVWSELPCSDFDVSSLFVVGRLA